MEWKREKSVSPHPRLTKSFLAGIKLACRFLTMSCDFLGSTSLCAINIAKSQTKISEIVMYVDGKLQINFHFLRHLILSGYLTDPEKQNNLLILDKLVCTTALNYKKSSIASTRSLKFYGRSVYSDTTCYKKKRNETIKIINAGKGTT